MRIAVILQVASTGGIWRFTRALIEGITEAEPDSHIGLFVDSELAIIENVDEYFREAPVDVVPIRDPRVTTGARRASSEEVRAEEDKSLIWRVGRDLIKLWPSLHRSARDLYVDLRSWAGGERSYTQFALPPEVRDQLGDYDLVYLALPLYIQPFECDLPIVATFHDLNYRHFPENFSRRHWRKWDADFRYWSRRADAAVTSTQFIKEDLVRAFPWTAGKARVVYLAPYGTKPVPDDECAAALNRFRLKAGRYAIYPSNTGAHKNLVAYVKAAALLKERFGDSAPPLVITGIGTDLLLRPNGSGYVEAIQDAMAENHLVFGREVRALGYVTDAEVDALTRSAAVVVSCSLYEAGCGPALDAWSAGVPVAFSNIPPFVEQLSALGVAALTFDPEVPAEIADRIAYLLTHPAEVEEMTSRSRAAMSAYSWDKVGAEYLSVFAEAIDRHQLALDTGRG